MKDLHITWHMPLNKGMIMQSPNFGERVFDMKPIVTLSDDESINFALLCIMSYMRANPNIKFEYEGYTYEFDRKLAKSHD